MFPIGRVRWGGAGLVVVGRTRGRIFTGDRENFKNKYVHTAQHAHLNLRRRYENRLQNREAVPPSSSCSVRSALATAPSADTSHEFRSRLLRLFTCKGRIAEIIRKHKTLIMWML